MNAEEVRADQSGAPDGDSQNPSSDSSATSSTGAENETPGQGFTLFEQKMAEKQSSRGGMRFDPAIIIALITAVIPLIQGCFANRRNRRSNVNVLRRRLLNRSRLAVAFRQEPVNMDWSESFQAATDCCDLADNSTDEELLSFVNDCCRS